MDEIQLQIEIHTLIKFKKTGVEREFNLYLFHHHRVFKTTKQKPSMDKLRLQGYN